jgi:transcriptional regulator with XRE-family HTH domain
MDRKAFGKLVATLRKDSHFTQQRVADTCLVSVRTVAELEKGNLKKIDTDLLTKLARALRLNALESKEFFWGALGMAYPTNTPAPMLLDSLLETLKIMRIPAYITNQYFDILAANDCLMQMYTIDVPLIEEAQEKNLLNGLFMVLHEGYQEMMKDAAQQQLLDHFHYFRGVTLRYRATERFGEVVEGLHGRFPTGFEPYWALSRTEACAAYLPTIPYHYVHPRYTHLSYHSAINHYAVSAGDFYLHSYIPLNEQTSSVFNEFAQHGRPPTLLALFDEAHYRAPQCDMENGPSQDG